VKVRDEDDVIQDVLQEAWTKLLKLREQDKIRNFDINVPSQLLSWLEDIYKTQLATYDVTDKDFAKHKRFAIAVNFRVTINNILGMDYFMKEMNDEPRMKAMDKVINDLYSQIRQDNEMKSAFR
jgi:hypothetical protein